MRNEENMRNEVFYEKCGTNIWIEEDILGRRHVVVQHKFGEEEIEPFTFCTFNYDYRYTCNAFLREAAEKMAKSLGATPPILIKDRRIMKG